MVAMHPRHVFCLSGKQGRHLLEVPAQSQAEAACLGQGMQQPCIFQGSPHAASGWRCSSQAGSSCSSNLLMLRSKRKDAGWEEGEGRSGGRG